MVLLIAYGNPGRGDDGLGPALADRIRRRGLPDVVVKIDYQLKVEHALDVSRSKTAIFVDAQIGAHAPYRFSPVEADISADISSHALSPGAVLTLSNLLFGAAPNAFTLGISGFEFDRIKEELCDQARENLRLAEAFLVQWLSVSRKGESAGQAPQI